VVTITLLPAWTRTPGVRSRRSRSPTWRSSGSSRRWSTASSRPRSDRAPRARRPSAAGFRLTFLARAGGPPLAVAQGPAACGTVHFSVGGQRQPELQITDSFILQVPKLADLHWKVP